MHAFAWQTGIQVARRGLCMFRQPDVRHLTKLGKLGLKTQDSVSFTTQQHCFDSSWGLSCLGVYWVCIR